MDIEDGLLVEAREVAGNVYLRCSRIHRLIAVLGQELVEASSLLNSVRYVHPYLFVLVKLKMTICVQSLHTVMKPSTTLFKVPAKALINTTTLAALYPPNHMRKLTAVQQITLHLLLWKPQGDEDSSDGAFGPYISTMPPEFDSHPLTWLVKLQNAQNDMKGSPEELLLKSLPPSVSAALNKLANRFRRDWAAVCRHLVSISDVWFV